MVVAGATGIGAGDGDVACAKTVCGDVRAKTAHREAISL